MSNWPKIGAFVVALLIIAGAKFFPFIPIPTIESAPTAATVPLPTLGQTILHANNMQAYWAVPGVTVWSVAAKGVVLHKITAAQALTEDNAIVGAEAQGPAEKALPRSVVLALLMSESDLDPQCQNGNFLGSNPTKDPLGYDDGVAQLKLRYLVGVAPGVTDAANAQAFAFDPPRAIPYFYRELADKVAWATQVIAEYPSVGDTRLHNPYMLAALAFKQGQTGAMTIYTSGQWPTELNNFVSLEAYFSTQLGEKSAFSSV